MQNDDHLRRPLTSPLRSLHPWGYTITGSDSGDDGEAASTTKRGKFDIFYIPQTPFSIPLGVTSSPATEQARQWDELEKLPLCHSWVPKIDWEPRTSEGLLTLVCPYPQVEDELLIIEDGGTLIFTYSETGPPGVFDEDHDVAIIFESIVRDRYYMRDLTLPLELVSLDVSGRVTIGRIASAGILNSRT